MSKLKPQGFLGWAGWACIALIVAGAMLRGASLNDDVSGDHAINSYRAIGWHDSLIAGQTGPFDHLGHTTWWSGLSFQDAPPLSFLIQRIFFACFGVSDAVARLPFALAGILGAILFYVYFSRIASRASALIGSALLSISAFSVYANISGYIEGIQSLFILLTLLACLFLVEKGGRKHLYAAVLFLGLSLLTKYTSLFLIPVVAAALILAVWKKKEEGREEKKKKKDEGDGIGAKQIILSIALLVGLLSPVIVYNLELYALRGHFDSAISAMVGMTSEDFGAINGRTIEGNIVGRAWGAMGTYVLGNSPLVRILFVLSFAYLVYSAVTKRERATATVLASLFFLVSMLAFVGGGRFALIMYPVASLAIAWAVHLVARDHGQYFESKNARWAIAAAFLVFCAFEICYTINSQLLSAPLGKEYVAYSPDRLSNRGFHELGAYIRSEVFPDSYPLQDIESVEDFYYSDKEIQGKNVLIYDDRIDWFAQFWYFISWQTYFGLPGIPSAYIAGLGDAVAEENGALSIKDWLAVTGKEVFVVFGAEQVLDTVRVKSDAKQESVARLYELVQGAKSVKVKNIKDASGKIAFVVYRISAY